MAVVYKGSAGGTVVATGDEGQYYYYTSVSRPADLAPFDYMVASVAVTGGVTAIAPDGWAQLARLDNSTLTLYVYGKAALDEPEQWTWQTDGNSATAAVVRYYSGVDRWWPVECSSGQTTASGTSHAIPEVKQAAWPGGACYVASWAAAKGGLSFTISAPGTGPWQFRNFFKINAGGVPAETSVYGADLHIPWGTSHTLAATYSTATIGCAHWLALRPAVESVTAGESDRLLKGLFPPGAEQVYDWDTDGADIADFMAATSEALKRGGFDLVDHLRQQIRPDQVTVDLASWETALGLAPLPSDTPRIRQAAIVGKLREYGAVTIPQIQAAIGPLLGYADPTDLVVMEINLVDLQTAHTYTGPQLTPGAADTDSGSVTVLDDGAGVSCAGARVLITMTCTDCSGPTVTLIAPDLTEYTADRLPAVDATTQQFVLYFPDVGRVVADGVVTDGEGIQGTWTLRIDTAAVEATVDWSLIVEADGRDAKGNDGLGAAVYEWAVFADSTVVNNPDYPAAIRAINRLTPAHATGYLVLDCLNVTPADVPAIPDEPQAVPGGVVLGPLGPRTGQACIPA